MTERTTDVAVATVHDAADIARIHTRSWQVAYANVLPAQQLAAIDVAQRAQRWASILRGNDSSGESTTSVGFYLTADGTREVAGFVSVGAGRDDKLPPPRPTELYALYLDPDAFGSGIAQKLVDSALGNQPAFLWVVKGNARATNFYRRNGFDFDGAETQLELLQTPVTAVRMVR